MIELLSVLLFFQETPTSPTWTKDVQPIIRSNCTPCHEVGGAGAFPLQTYEDVAGRATFILELTSAKVMPPWIPDDSGLPILHKRDISKDEIAILQKWLEAGKPKGDSTEIRVCGGALKVPTARGQTKPTMTWVIPAESETRWHQGIRDKQTFVLPIKNSSPMKITSFKFKTTAPRAVQMVGFVFDHQGRGRTFDGWDPDELGYEMMGDIGWAPSGIHGKVGPGSGEIELPHGFHWDVPVNVDLIAETHFRPLGKREHLSCSVTIQSDVSVDSRAIQEIVTMMRRIYIEAEDNDYSVDETIELPVAVDFIGITPRAGAECASMKISVEDLEGKTKTLFSIPNWDPHYGETVFFKKPFRLERGVKVTSIWNYNNSESNPRNPFVPAQRIDLSRKTGIANFILHVAPVNLDDTEALSEWNVSMLRTRQHSQK